MENNTIYIQPKIILGRIRLMYRWTRFALVSLRHGWFDFITNAIRAIVKLLYLTTHDLLPSPNIKTCNICGWKGSNFYPNVGPGYYERETICPRCHCQDRHRSLVTILNNSTSFFSYNSRVIEVAPMRSFQQYALQRKGGTNYISFDLERYAMERGDITNMRYNNEACDYFLCFHVLEHITDEGTAIKEIHRVLSPGGTLVIQVPVDWNLTETKEYGKPNPRETNHVRSYGKDFPMRLKQHGFTVTPHTVHEYCSVADIIQNGLSEEPIFFAKKLKR